MVNIKGKILFLVSALVITSITIAAYPVISANSQLGQGNNANLVSNANNNHKTNSINKISTNGLPDQINSNVKRSGPQKYTTSKVNAKSSKSRSIAQKYIKEPNAVAGKPERYNIGGKCTDVVPVLLKGKRVGEIDIDPKTEKNVGGAGGAP
ncbi:hypothetical protein [Methanobacterium sp.]|uniref:hypothetical protein n=1 Tax=Methanobacterium sp. TaxID=2164 RepID=UPI003C780457